MNYDEEILKRKKLLRQMAENVQQEQLDSEKDKSILDGSVPIYGEEFAFERRILEGTNISIVMPVILEKLDDDMKKLMFPMGNTPETAYSTDRDLFNIVIKRTNHIVPQDNIMDFTKASSQLLEKMGPQIKILKNYLCDIEDMQIGVMEYLTMALDGKAHNISCIFPFKEGVLLIGFSFSVNVKERIHPIIMEMLRTIHIEED